MKIREEAFPYYFIFMKNRMEIFRRRYDKDQNQPIHDDIINKHRFTNVYRASDRVSQYLIRNVIYDNKNRSSEDTLFRILIFKVFNRIDTWEYLENRLGDISIVDYDPSIYSKLLSERISKRPIFNSAYLMTGVHSDYLSYNSKHERWLRMIDKEFIKENGFLEIECASSLEGVYSLLRTKPFIGDFLAYQYAIDFNYSPVINFSENSFVKAGIGAVRGVKKCFKDLGKYTCEDAIRFMYDNLDVFFERYTGTQFNNLFGRDPHLIDLQNCFCETDKYLRVQLPQLVVDNIRIKQKYKVNNKELSLYFPPKWGINDKINNLCLQQNTKELTLF